MSQPRTPLELGQHVCVYVTRTPLELDLCMYVTQPRTPLELQVAALLKDNRAALPQGPALSASEELALRAKSLDEVCCRAVMARELSNRFAQGYIGYVHSGLQLSNVQSLYILCLPIAQ